MWEHGSARLETPNTFFAFFREAETRKVKGSEKGGQPV
jgi:hypothetical protein